MARYLYSELSSLIDARKRCAESSTSGDWFDRHTDTIEALVKQHLPHGSGFDCGTKINLDASHADKLVFTTEFHHMNDGGYYDGWTYHTVTVTPSLLSKYHLRVSGRNRNEIKDLIHESFDVALSTDVTYDLLLPRFPQFAFKSTWESNELVFSASDGTQFRGSDRNATNTYMGSPYERARAYAALQMERAQYAQQNVSATQ